MSKEQEENTNDQQRKKIDRRGKNKKKILERKAACLKLFKHLSLPNPIFFNFPDNEMDKVSLLKIVKKVEEKIRHFTPDTVITHYSHCLNIDHRMTFEAVITACRPINNLSVKKILSFFVILFLVISPASIKLRFPPQ
mgnify:CR=1 FL=1